MERKAMILIRENGEQDPSFVTEGKVIKDDGGWKIAYSAGEKAIYSISVSGKTATVDVTGEMSYSLLLCEGRESQICLRTPYGDIIETILSKLVCLAEKSDGIEVKLEYEMYTDKKFTTHNFQIFCDCKYIE